jgi:two-component system response regulator FlrC
MVAFTVLVVEDDDSLRDALIDTFELQSDMNVVAANSAEEAIARLNEVNVDLVVSDVQMPGLSGYELLKNIHQSAPEIPVILMTAYGNIHDAVIAMQNGASDYITKPFEPQLLISKVERYLPSFNHETVNPIVQDESSRKLLAMAKKVATTDATILISGESGTGKEVMARYVHDNSPRRDKPFVAINCAAIPENMLEATLFGYEKGSFTGAVKSTEGKFEQAQGGTILLDEISEMDMGLQAKLLRVLQEKEVERIGSRKTIDLDVRVIATTNRNLKEYVQEGNFREDLYYRLNVFPLHWLPLRERPEDILPIAEFILEKHSVKQGLAKSTISEGAKLKLAQYTWPGNIREMENVIQRALILSSGEEITEHDIHLETNVSIAPAVSPQVEVAPAQKGNNKLNDVLKEQEYKQIIEALKEYNGNRTKVAEQLGISQRTLRYKMAKMRNEGIEID